MKSDAIKIKIMNNIESTKKNLTKEFEIVFKRISEECCFDDSLSKLDFKSIIIISNRYHYQQSFSSSMHHR